MAGQITIQGVDELMLSLDRLNTKRIDKDVRAITREVLKIARKSVANSAKGMLDNDPRQAYRAVKMSVYKRVMGGSVSILSKRRRSGTAYSVPSSSRGRSNRTTNIMSYYGADRGFILRFMNAGTTSRTVTSINAHTIDRSLSERHPKGTQPNRNYRSQRQYKGGLGNRGSISARNWFPGASQPAMDQAAQKFTELVERLIVEKYENKTK